jgi:predicted flap endonuclease-1-like 5' DNA nuclease
MEADCGTDSFNQNSVPSDEDGDEICDALDTILDLPFTMTYPSDTLTLTLGNEINIQLPTVSGLGEVATWEISSELPTGLIFGWSPARDAHLDGSITGTPTETMDVTKFTIWANNFAHGQSFNIIISVIEEVIDSEDSDDDDDESGIMAWGYICLPLILLLLLLLFVIFIPGNKQVIDDAEPENTTAKPKFAEGEGTKENPFILTPANDVNPGNTIYSEELITITNITPGLKIQSIDYLDQQGGRKFTMADLTYGNEEVRMFEADEEGVIKFQLIFDDSLEPTLAGGEFQGAIKIGRNSVYLMWDVKVNADPEYVKQQENLESESEKAIADAEAKSKAKAESKAKAKAEAKVKAQTEAETEKLRAKKLAELARVRARAKTIDFGTLGIATIDEQDDLQVIKGIGPFIAEKLNALGIYTFDQVGNMTPKIEEEVNQAIEFFSGRIKRDEWAKQAKELAKNK